MIAIEPIYVMLYLFYIPERVPYDREIQKIELIPYQRKKRPKFDGNFFNSFLFVKGKLINYIRGRRAEEKLVKVNTGEKESK
ncbi:22091_t:CDS:2 [Rhizophagus irregularis]|nr:22091_t:CDS:2 [Rhizophagus irregularis]